MEIMEITYAILTDDTLRIEVSRSLGNLKNTITLVRFIYVGISKSGEAGTYSGITRLPIDLQVTNYKPFDQVTNEDIVSWLLEHSDIENMQASIKLQIEEKINQ